MHQIGRFGSKDAALEALTRRVIRYQKRAQEAERQAEAARKLVPAEGALILTGEEAVAIRKLREEKVDLGKISATIKNAHEFAAKAAKEQRAADITTAAGSRWKPKVLERLIGDHPLVFKDGFLKDGDELKELKIAYIKVGDVLEKFDEWFEREQKDWVEVATADPDGTETTESKPGLSVPPQKKSTPAAPAVGKGKAQTKDLIQAVDAHMGSRYTTPSALAKKT
jgi:hypothetical protein